MIDGGLVRAGLMALATALGPCGIWLLWASFYDPAAGAPAFLLLSLASAIVLWLPEA